MHDYISADWVVSAPEEDLCLSLIFAHFDESQLALSSFLSLSLSLPQQDLAVGFNFQELAFVCCNARRRSGFAALIAM